MSLSPKLRTIHAMTSRATITTLIQRNLSIRSSRPGGGSRSRMLPVSAICSCNSPYSIDVCPCKASCAAFSSPQPKPRASQSVRTPLRAVRLVHRAMSKGKPVCAHPCLHILPQGIFRKDRLQDTAPPTCRQQLAPALRDQCATVNTPETCGIVPRSTQAPPVLP